MTNTLLKYENSKLKEQLIFNIPVSKEICGRQCEGCYALKPQQRFPSVLASRERKYEASLDIGFHLKMDEELVYWDKWLTKNRPDVKQRVVRIHESGEFYSDDYINKWTIIALCKQEFTFYAFTKRLKDFPYLFGIFKSLDNVHIIDSLYEDNINFGDDVTKTDMFVCPATTNHTDCSPEICRYCYKENGASENGVYFKKH